MPHSTPPQTLDATQCYPALRARDARFDGYWFVGVSSTGVYCRPVCRVRTPLERNCTFYTHAAAAELAGFRPCLKCRPELAPRAYSAFEATRSLADAARARLDAGVDASLATLAERLGVTDRHLRRVFVAQFGVTPQQYLQTQRLLLAKRLLTDTQAPVAEVALRAGFGSLRAFQHAWGTQYRLPPSQLRRQATAADKVADASLQLSYRQPYDALALLRFLALRAVPGVELVDETGLRLTRNLRLFGAAGQVALAFQLERRVLRVQASPALWQHTAALLALLRQWLDLDADPDAIAVHLRVAGLPVTAGLRLPGCPDRFELCVRALLGQQITVAAARTLATRLVAQFGEDLPEAERLHPDAPSRLFPRFERLAHAGEAEIARIGMPGSRARALQGLARAWPGLAFAQGLGTPEQAEAELQQLSGIGPWTAAYAIMRGWPWPDRFLPGDVVLKKRLAARPALRPEACAPYRSYAVLHLWNINE